MGLKGPPGPHGEIIPCEYILTLAWVLVLPTVVVTQIILCIKEFVTPLIFTEFLFPSLYTSIWHFRVSLLWKVLPAWALDAHVNWLPPEWLSMCLFNCEEYRKLWLHCVHACFFLSSSCISMWFLYPVVDSNCLPHWSHFHCSSFWWCFSMCLL